MAHLGNASGSYSFGGTATGTRTRLGSASCAFGWSGTPTGHVQRKGNASGGFDFSLVRAVGDNGDFLPDDRFRIIVQETQGGAFLSRDLTVTNLVIQRALSGPCDIQFDVNPNDPTVRGIYFKPWEQYIHVEKTMQGKRKIWASAIVQPSDIDEKTGILHLKAKGFAGYPKGLPWLEDLNWVANDAYEPIVEIWRYLQDYPNGNLNVEVFPTTSGIEMLPGYSYDGSTMNLNFFATFVRAADKLDCGDYIDALARDIPFDYAERSQWNHDRTDVVKKIELGYPRLGLIQTHLAFVLNENVLSAKAHTETQIDWISDIGVTGFFPGFQYCVSDDTEILTREGWKRYDEIDVGTTTLTLNNETGLAEWQPVQAVNVFEGERWLYETEFRGHSSATTAEHRWPVSWYSYLGEPRKRRWSTTASLLKNEMIDCAAPVVDLPSTPKYDDALVELLAWYWTEGTWTVPGGKITIAQYGHHIGRIKAAATRLFGRERRSKERAHWGDWRGSIWQTNSTGTGIKLGAEISLALLEHITDYRTKAISYDFIANLTQAQLELFINCSVWADCDGDWNPAKHANFGQKYECNIDMLQFACQLAGRKTTKRQEVANGGPWYVLGIYSQHRTTVKATSMLSNMERRWHKGVVWCPTTANGTWCARRNGTVYFTGNSSELANADPNRLRRYLDETNANLDSNERTAAWGHRLLARRQTPAYWEKIIVDMHHPNAPFGTFDVGDTITVSGPMPWIGEVSQDHKIIAIGVDDTKNVCQLTLKADGEFNYDPIFFPDGTTNIINNRGFDFNLNGWTPSGPGWTHDASQGVAHLGSATITADGSDHDLLTQPYGVSHFQIFPLAIQVKCSGAVSATDGGVQLVAQFYDDDLVPTQAFQIAHTTNLKGIVPWQKLKGNVLTPGGSTKVAMRLHVGAEMTAGQVWFDDAEITL